MNNMEKLKLLSSASQIEAGEDGCNPIEITAYFGV
jgi:hypothetical protein